ncbi:MAG: FlgD immunoglobulin-like domain containing protein [Candidatus Latescibacterota bacterium]|nr:FlgD immunoglobulin-like domain containing protein [Candidatus Latescibacterota bacterium]
MADSAGVRQPMLILLLGLGAVISSSPCLAQEAETFSIGGGGRSWQDVGTAPGGVIDFVDRLGDVTDLAGESVFVGAPDSLRGWIAPLRLRPDVNISLGVLDRGGSIDVNLSSDEVDEEALEGVINGDHKVAFDRKLIPGRTIVNNGVKIEIDLGARFGVNRIIFYPRMTAAFQFDNDFLRGYELSLNDGLVLTPSGAPDFGSPEVRDADNREVRVETVIEPQFVRFLEVKSITFVGFEIDEIEVYGTGFVPNARYMSEILDFDDGVMWGGIGWTEIIAGDPTASSMEVRVRSGRDPTPDVYFRILTVGSRVTGRTRLDANGDTLTLATYERLLRQGQRVEIDVDADNWSPWQLVGNGADLVLPAPRQFFQFRIDFASQSLDAGRAVSDFSFQLGRNPPADLLVAEVSPPVVEAGVPTTFTYVVRVVNTTGRGGFERFEIETPARVTAIRSVEIQDEQSNRLSGAEFGDLSAPMPIEVGDFSVVAVEDDHFALEVPRIVADGTRLKIVFDTAAFRYGTRFRGRAFSHSSAALPLLSEGGDATPELLTDAQLVRVSVGSSVAGPLEAEPPVFTPNGDGVNETTQVAFTVLHLLDPSPVEVGIFDLAGRRVRRLVTELVVNGRFSFTWDGRTDGDELVPPGVYMVAFEIRSDSRTERRIGSVAVVY